MPTRLTVCRWGAETPNCLSSPEVDSRLAPEIEEYFGCNFMLNAVIVDYLTKNAGVDPAKFENPDLMVADLGLDSLGLVEMLFEVEDRFGFQIPDPMRFQAMTFADMVAAIEESVREHSNGQLAETPPVGSVAPAK
ncbi:acyl carrier protein [Ramlibacter sp.]